MQQRHEREETDALQWVRQMLDDLSGVEDEDEHLAGIDLFQPVQEFVCDSTENDRPLEERVQFLEAASELLHKKARSFVRTPEEEEAPEEMEDSERSERLLEHLLEYRRYQVVAEKLREQAEEMGRSHPRVPPEIAEWEEALADIEGAGLSDLVSALEDILAEDLPDVQTIEREPITVSQCMHDIREKLQDADGPVEFSSIFPLHLGRERVVVTFVALLEMIRRREVEVAQSERFGPILLYGFRAEESTGR